MKFDKFHQISFLGKLVLHHNDQVLLDNNETGVSMHKLFRSSTRPYITIHIHTVWSFSPDWMYLNNHFGPFHKKLY